MKAYKNIFPLSLIILMIAIILNTDSISIGNFGSNNSFSGDFLIKTIRLPENSNSDDELLELSLNRCRIAEVAYNEIGNVGGEKFWSWYGFNGYAPWCACFVSWCANQCGYLETGVIPKFAAVSVGYNWFVNNGQWQWKDEEPRPGMIIFFDFTNMDMENIKDGIPDHVGIVKNVLDGYVYCIEGNYHDTCSETKYSLNHTNIFGYGTPNY